MGYADQGFNTSHTLCRVVANCGLNSGPSRHIGSTELFFFQLPPASGRCSLNQLTDLRTHFRGHNPKLKE